MSPSGEGRSDAGSNTELQGETVIDFNGDSAVGQSSDDIVDARQTQPQPNQQHESESQERHDGWESNARVRYAIYREVNKGDWKTAKEIYKTNSLSFDAPITAERQTALHIAALAGRSQFVRELMKEMTDDGLCLPDSDGNTALYFAVVSGKLALVEAMLQRKMDFAMLKNNDDQLPIYNAILSGHSDIVKYLFGACKDRLEVDDRANLLVPLIVADMYDTALDLVKGEWFANYMQGYKVEALNALARKPHLSASTSSQVQSSKASRRCFINPFWNLITSREVQKIILNQRARDLAEYICDKVASDDNELSYMERERWRPIFVATEQGNVGFLRILIEKLPDAVIKRNKDGQIIFHVAVCFRRAKVFNLLGETGSIYLTAKYRDNRGNSVLHLAGGLAPSDNLDAVPGAALQLQRELLWFKIVKKLVGPILAEAKNKDGRSPYDVFKENHKSLIKEAEEWMKRTADSCSIVAALVATVVFAAAFTAPGGNDQTTGFPIFLNKASFKIFIVSDAISLISALSSLLTFMSIQTSTYSMKDFVKSLPIKLLIGYSTLFISIAAMLVAFVTVLFAYFRQHQLLSVALPLVLVAVFPIGLFASLHYRLLAGMIMFWQALKNIPD